MLLHSIGTMTDWKSNRYVMRGNEMEMMYNGPDGKIIKCKGCRKILFVERTFDTKNTICDKCNGTFAEVIKSSSTTGFLNFARKSGQKYVLTQMKKIVSGHTLQKIMSCKTFGFSIGRLNVTIMQGEIGGHIEHERNLPHDSNAWVRYGTICDSAVITGNSFIFKSKIWDDAVINNSEVTGSEIGGNTEICSSFVLLSKIRRGSVCIQKSEIRDSDISDDVYMSDCCIRKCNISGHIFVSGNFHLVDGTLNGTQGFYSKNEKPFYVNLKGMKENKQEQFGESKLVGICRDCGSYYAFP